MCGTNSSNPPLPDDPRDIGPNASAAAGIKAIADELSSVLAAAKVDTATACYLPTSPDGDPIIGVVPGVEGLYMAAGHTCWGILNGPATGQLLAGVVR